MPCHLSQVEKSDPKSNKQTRYIWFQIGADEAGDEENGGDNWNRTTR